MDHVRSLRELAERSAALLIAVLLAATACSSDQDAAETTTIPASPPPTLTGGPPPSNPGGAPPTPPDLAAVSLKLTQIAVLAAPTAFAASPSEPGVAYVTERAGRLRRLNLSNGAVEPTAVLDLTDETTTDGERGLLGLAFSADGAKLYLSFTDRNGDSAVDEWSWRAGQPDLASRRPLLRIDQPFANHNGGGVVVGPDRMLWMGWGDGGSQGDPEGNGQRLDTLLGKLLRIDPTKPGGGRAYGIPDGNPFATRAGARPEIWAYGLRNPWRFSFDRVTGDLWMGDVGQNAVEEIDLLPAAAGRAPGANLGWNRMEGDQPFRGGSPPPDHLGPVFTYANGGDRCSVTGGVVYRGSAVARLAGAYLFGDYCEGVLQGLVNGVDPQPADGAPAKPAQTKRFDSARLEGLVAFGEDERGEVYLLSVRSGAVSRIDPA
ncbi:MAG: PQQ-dependent sugar dehydrogenase [Acidimicrobiales bacterium]